jgi:hypothetical protein
VGSRIIITGDLVTEAEAKVLIRCGHKVGKGGASAPDSPLDDFAMFRELLAGKPKKAELEGALELLGLVPENYATNGERVAAIQKAIG